MVDLFHVSTNSSANHLVPNVGSFIPIKCRVNGEAMRNEKRVLVLPPNSTFAHFHACRELLTSLTHTRAGEVRPRDVVLNAPLLWG